MRGEGGAGGLVRAVFRYGGPFSEYWFGRLVKRASRGRINVGRSMSESDWVCGKVVSGVTHMLVRVKAYDLYGRRGIATVLPIVG